MKPLSQQNLYEVLDVPFDASPGAIAEAVDRAQALYAPGSLATYTLMDPEEERLLARLLEEARTTLLDPVARARYDERITGPDQQAVPAPVVAVSPAVDAAIRTAWPELPPVIPALQSAAQAADEDEEGEEEERAPTLTPAPMRAAATPPPAEPSPPAMAPVIPAAVPQPPRVSPILLSREVAAPPAAPVATPVPMIPISPPAAAPPVPEASVWSGEVLRKLREARGISLQQISERTKVTRHHIENIEADRFEQLPAAVYLRGILLSIARELRLDGPKVARSYLERVSAAFAASSPPQRQR